MGTQTQQGSSLVEVMVALFVLAIGLLGMLAMQTKSMQYNQSAYTYSQASYLANDMVERIRTNRAAGASYIDGNMPSAKPTGDGNDCEGFVCAPAALAAWDLFNVQQNVANYLPGGTIAFVPQTVAGVDYIRVVISFENRIRDEDPDEIVDPNATDIKEYALLVEI